MQSSIKSSNHKMEFKCDIMSIQSIKPSNSIPNNLKQFKLSFLDQLSPHQYVPFLLFYTASDSSFASLCHKLKASLSDVLTFYYPFCGRIKENAYVDCNDAGVLFIEARVNSSLADILENPQVSMLKQFLPVDTHGPGASYTNKEEPALVAVQASEFSCGGVGIGVCILHAVTDGIAAAAFLNAWVAMANGSGGDMKKPYMEGSLLFPTKEMKFSSPLAGRVDNRALITARLLFNGTSLSKLKAEMDAYTQDVEASGTNGHNYNPTRVEAVTALLWKSMMEESCKREKLVRSLATHVVNIRNRMEPPLPEHSIGNVVQLAVTPLVELDLQAENKEFELRDLAMMVRKAITRFDSDYVKKIVGDEGFDLVQESMKQVMPKNLEGIQWCDFTSWTRFPLYEADFGWGKPIWVSTYASPMKNNVTLMPTKCGQGIEAWVNLDEQDMVGFEGNAKLLQYASISRA